MQRLFSERLARGVYACNESRACRFDISFNARHLSCKVYSLLSRVYQAIALVKTVGRVEVGVAVHHAVAQELRVLKSGDHSEYSSLLGEGQVSLEADEVIHTSLSVFFSELYYGIRLLAHALIYKSDGLQGSEKQSFSSSASHYLYGHTALKYLEILLLFAVKLLECRFLSRDKRLPEGVILLLVHRAVDIIGVALVVS